MQKLTHERKKRICLGWLLGMFVFRNTCYCECYVSVYSSYIDT